MEQGIIEPSVSPWWAQAFVVKETGHKPRMVIDYSETVNKYTTVDAYPFSDMFSLLDDSTKYQYFSKLDLKSAYHQIPLKDFDKKFAAFAAGGKLYQFIRLPFGITNAVPIFQRIMDDFVSRNKLQDAMSYLDDVQIGGKTKKEHDENLKNFIDTAAKEGLTKKNVISD